MLNVVAMLKYFDNVQSPFLSAKRTSLPSSVRGVQCDGLIA